MPQLRKARLSVLLLALSGFSVQACASFEGLGDLPGGARSSTASGISGDGSTVVGSTSVEAGGEGFRWTRAKGLVGLDDLAGGRHQSAATDVSDNGVVVGTSRDSGGNHAFIWTEGEGMQPLPGIKAAGVSADGSVAVGLALRGSISDAFRWTPTSFELLGNLGGSEVSRALAVSASGNVVVGLTSSVDSLNLAFRWTPETGMTSLGTLPGGGRSDARAVSRAGDVVVGGGDSSQGRQAFRWTAEGGMRGLGDIPGAEFGSYALGVSADGSTVVGQGTSARGNEAAIWSAERGMQSVQDVLELSYGLELNGWTLQSATGISADCRSIVGVGSNPAGDTEAWLAILPKRAACGGGK